MDNYLIKTAKSLDELRRIYGESTILEDGNLNGVFYKGNVLWYRYDERIGYVLFGSTKTVLQDVSRKTA